MNKEGIVLVVILIAVIPNRDAKRSNVNFPRVNNVKMLLEETPMWFIYSKSECDATVKKDSKL